MTLNLQAGIARRIISPSKGIYLIGYGNRSWGNRGIRDDLTATALALDDGETRSVIVACDLLAINEFTLSEIKSLVNENIILCCSHTHSGPVVYSGKKSRRKNRKYVNYLISQIVDVVLESLGKLQPATLAWGTGEAGIAINRRERKSDGRIEIGKNPEGVVDRTVGIIQARSLNGEPLANLVNFSCHNVVLGPNNLLVSADWAGAMRKQIEAETGVPCLFIQGATADLNPDYEWGEKDSEMVNILGETVARVVLENLSQLTPINGIPIKHEESEIWLPTESEALTPNPPKTYRFKVSKSLNIPRALVDPLLNFRYPWKTNIENKDGYWSIPMNLSVLQIGEIMWIGLGAEVFTQIGIDVKEYSASPYTFFSSITNGCIGYLPTLDEFPKGGYEIDIAPLAYRLPGRFQPAVGEITMRVIKKSLDSLM